MRIDSSGNLFIGKTATGFTTPGLEFFNDGLCAITRDSNVPVVINRETDNGDIILLRKDNSTVGRIAANDGDLLIGTGDTGFRFYNAGSAIIPNNISTPGNRDNAIDLGFSSVRYKDLYLGGGLYVGGTGTANKLDDYEEGTWTPTYTTSGTDFTSVSYSFQIGTYTKIGNIVYISGRMRTTGMTKGSADGNVLIGGLPFTCEGSESAFNLGYAKDFLGENPLSGLSRDSNNTFFMYYRGTAVAGAQPTQVSDMSTGSSSNMVYFSGVYHTTA